MQYVDIRTSRISQLVLLQLLFCGFLFAISAARITEGPTNLTVEPGDWAEFNCTVPCECIHAWYVEGFPVIRDPDYDYGPDLQLMSDYIVHGDGMFTATLRILATEALDGAAVQCSTLTHDPTCREGQVQPNCGTVFTDYSRFAVLSVVSDDPPPTPTSTPVPCPSPTPVLVTTTTTVTQTITVTVTETPELTGTPTCTPPHVSAQTSPINFGLALSFLTALLATAAAVLLLL